MSLCCVRNTVTVTVTFWPDVFSLCPFHHNGDTKYQGQHIKLSLTSLGSSVCSLWLYSFWRENESPMAETLITRVSGSVAIASENWSNWKSGGQLQKVWEQTTTLLKSLVVIAQTFWYRVVDYQTFWFLKKSCSLLPDLPIDHQTFPVVGLQPKSWPPDKP